MGRKQKIFVIGMLYIVVILLVAYTIKSFHFLGEDLVKAMYDFDSPQELGRNQEIVRYLLVEEDWERLQLDNNLRSINAYYKFGYAPSEVQVLTNRSGYCAYKLKNKNISEYNRWLLLYEQHNGEVSEVREYRLIAGGGSKSFDYFCINS